MSARLSGAGSAPYSMTTTACPWMDGRSRGWYRPRAVAMATMVLGALMVAGLVWRLDGQGRPAEGLMPLTQAVPLYCAGLFVACMFCHGELVLLKPSPRYLTRFYLMISLGGAVGSVLVGILAP